MEASHPLPVAYLRHLINTRPGSVTVTCDDADVATALFRAGAIELQGAPSAAVKGAAYPQADELIRFQGRRGEIWVTTLFHEPLLLDEGMRRLRGLLDGTRDCQALAQTASCSVDIMRAKLDDLASHGVLIESSRCVSNQQP